MYKVVNNHVRICDVWTEHGKLLGRVELSSRLKNTEEHEQIIRVAMAYSRDLGPLREVTRRITLTEAAIGNSFAKIANTQLSCANMVTRIGKAAKMAMVKGEWESAVFVDQAFRVVIF